MTAESSSAASNEPEPQVRDALADYEPPCIESGSPLIPGQEELIGPGVRGYAIEQDGTVYIPLIIADKEGSGDVGRFLDSLSHRCVIPTVTSPRLGAMLMRRGWAPEYDGDVDIWSRKRGSSHD